MGKISLSNIAEELAAKGGLTRDAADNFMRAFVETIEKGLQEDGMVKVKGLGTFKLQEVSDRGSVDVNTGERITIKGYRKVTFTPDSAMKEFVNRPFAHFEPTELNDGYPDDEELVVSDDNADDNEAAEVVEALVETSAEMSAQPLADVVDEEDAKVATEAITAEENAEEAITGETTIEETVVEEAVVEETVVEEAVAEETETVEEEATETIEEQPVIVVEEPQDEAVATAATTETTETTETSGVTHATHVESETNNEAPKQESKKRRGCGCWITLCVLLALAAVLAYTFGWLTLPDTDEALYEEVSEEYSDIVVKPNLEEELGAEWGDEPKVKPQLPVEKEDTHAVSGNQSESTIQVSPQEDSALQKVDAPVVVESSKLQVAEPKESVAEANFCAVTLTESLKSKSIKDITPADTTDYTMDGTLVTHELKRGETIIQLAMKYYGDKRLWPYIVKYNWMKDFNNVAIGQMINIPVLKDRPTE